MFSTAVPSRLTVREPGYYEFHAVSLRERVDVNVFGDNANVRLFLMLKLPDRPVMQVASDSRFYLAAWYVPAAAHSCMFAATLPAAAFVEMYISNHAVGAPLRPLVLAPVQNALHVTAIRAATLS
jgi:hypothetical protein